MNSKDITQLAKERLSSEDLVDDILQALYDNLRLSGFNVLRNPRRFNDKRNPDSR